MGVLIDDPFVLPVHRFGCTGTSICHIKSRLNRVTCAIMKGMQRERERESWSSSVFAAFCSERRDNVVIQHCLY